MRSTGRTNRRRVNIKMRILAGVIITAIAFPFTPAQAEAAKKEIVKAYDTAKGILNRVGSSSVKAARPVFPQTFETPSQRASHVARLRLCPRRLVLYADETFTLAPLALDSNREIIHSVHQRWESDNTSVVEISSVGEITAIAPGKTLVTVEVGNARASVAVEVREGLRPVQSDSEYDLNHEGDCEDPESAQLPESQSGISENLHRASSTTNKISGNSDDEGDLSNLAQPALLETDASQPARALRPEPAMNARGEKGAPPSQNIGLIEGDGGDSSSPAAAAYNNAIGSPRFAAQLLSETGGINTKKVLGSYNYGLGIPVLGLAGRGMDIGLALVYNSQLWIKDTGKMTFNYNKGWPTFGWSLGYGRIIENFDSSSTGDGSANGENNAPGNRLLLEPDGTRTYLEQKWDSVAQKWKFNSTDGTFIHLNGPTGRLKYPDGTEVNYEKVNNRLLPLWIKNANGDQITITYRQHSASFKFRWAVDYITDSLGRNIVFNYDPTSGLLTSITAPDFNGNPRAVVQIDYQTVTLKYDFVSTFTVTAPPNDTPIEVVRRVYHPQTGRGYIFSDYSTYGMARRVAMNIGMTATSDGTEISYTSYNYTTITSDPNDPGMQVGSLNDSPQYTTRKEWWLDKTDDNGLPTSDPTVYTYSRVKDVAAQVEIHTETEVLRNVKMVNTIDNNPVSISQGAVKSSVIKDASDNELQRTNYFYIHPSDGGVQVSSIRSINEAGQNSVTRWIYGNYGRVHEIWEENFSAVVQRKTKYFYIDNSNYLDKQMLRLVKRIEVYNSSDVMVGKTIFTYDDYAVMGGMEFYNMPTNPYPPNHDANFNQNLTIRGNVTGVETFSSISPSVSTIKYSKYDIFGNIVEAQVSCCGVKSAHFGTTSGSATLYSQPDFLTDGRDGITPFLKTSYQYNFYTGLVNQMTDANNQTTTFEYDAALRPLRLTLPTGTTTETKFDKAANGTDLLPYTDKVSYTDAGGIPKTITTKSWFDGAGHTLRKGTGQGSSPTSYDAVKLVYDSLGRAIRQSNPYLGNLNGDGSPQHWTVNTYDDLGRTIEITLPDGQKVLTDYNGAEITITDQVGRKRKSEVDALGRLIKLTEQDPATGSLSVLTTYSYDTFNNLTQVNQGNQTRTFQYDALSRPVLQNTPEEGTVTFTYTDFNSVLKRVDSRNVETHYSYDDLNRLKQVWYTGPGGNDSGTVRPPLPAGVEPTADVIIQYRTTAPGNGQVSRTDDSAGYETYIYDSFGRPTSMSRVITGSSATYTTAYEYNQIGQQTSITYPSGKKVRANYDARGRLIGLDKMNGPTVALSYMSQMQYNVSGQVEGLTLGNGIVEDYNYSAQRLQLDSQSATKGAATLMSLNYNYSASAGASGAATTSGNSGQLMSVSGTINGQGRNQTFTYDNLGRLKTSVGWAAGQTRRYEYDRWGNRTGMWDSISGGNQLQSVTLQQQTAGVPNNRVAAVNGLSQVYDIAGNLISDGEHNYSYDAENRLVKVDNGSSAVYSYDSANRRVKRQTPQGTTYYIWEGGAVIAEYTDSEPQGAGGVKYYLADRLSTKMMTNSTGGVLGTQDHLPFGEEAGAFGEVEKRQFTNYERDDETETDYAINRQYSHKTGRFMRPDPAAGSVANPQSLNRYAYAGNDPINSSDPLGLFTWPCIIDGINQPCQLALSIIQSGAFSSASISLNGSTQTINRADFSKFIPSNSEPVWDPELNSYVVDFGTIWFDYKGYEAAIQRFQAWVINATGGALSGFGTSLLYATAFENRISGTGQARLGRPRPKWPFWDRSFHFDGPHGNVSYPHFNAEFGPFRRFNHARIPSSLYRLGSTTALKTIGRGTVIVGVGLDIYDIATASPGSDRNRAIGGALGGWGGAALGAAIGSAIAPGIGTVIGGVIGGFFGSLGGQYAGKKF